MAHAASLTPALVRFTAQARREREQAGRWRRTRWAAAGLLLTALALALAGGAWTLDRLFPPNLARLDAVGTEVLDRGGRLVALLPAPGGVWRFRAGVDDVLLEQVWVHDGESRVRAVVSKAGAKLGGFERFKVGEGIEKPTDDFAAEVAAASGIGI